MQVPFFFKIFLLRMVSYDTVSILSNAYIIDDIDGLLLLLLLHLVTHPTKCYTKSKERAPSEKPTLNKCVFKCFSKIAGPTVRSFNSTGNSFQQLGSATAVGSHTPIRPVARHNKIPTNDGSQSRPTRNC